MRILLVGGNGQVGRELRRTLAPLGDLVVATRDGTLPDGRRCEVADLAAPDTLPALVARTAPDLVVNAGAYTAVDKAEQEPELAHRINAAAPGALAAACARAGIGLVHYSTDYVFDGAATRPYAEFDATGPLGVYGASKLAGEDAVRASGAAHKIFRLCWVYSVHGRNFLLTMLRLAGERDTLRVVADQTGTPTPAHWIADATADALVRRPELSGTWHLAARGQATWHGFASAIVERAAAMGLIARAPTVEPITTADYPTPAHRPAYSVLDTGKLMEFDIDLPDWRTGLDEVLSSLKSG